MPQLHSGALGVGRRPDSHSSWSGESCARCQPSWARLAGEREHVERGRAGQFLLECAVRGKVTKRSLDSWLAQLSERDDRRAAAEALRARLVEKVNEVQLGGRREAA
jgi:hypothetical protein